MKTWRINNDAVEWNLIEELKMGSNCRVVCVSVSAVHECFVLKSIHSMARAIAKTKTEPKTD